jgi:type IV secretion system protein TrbG
MKSIIASAAMICIATSAIAQQVPQGAVSFPPQVQVGPKLSPMNAKEKRALALSKKRINNNLLPTAGPDGAVVFMYGHTEPFVVCAPGRWCAIRLEVGEIISGGAEAVRVTDSENWFAEAAAYGTRQEIITEVRVCPKYPDMQAQLIFGTTKGRRYIVNLRSTQTQYVGLTAFSYPDDEVKKSNAEYQAKVQQQEAPAVRDIVSISSVLDANYDIRGNGSPRPVSVYNDGQRTVIDFGQELTTMPVIMGENDDGDLFSSATRYVLNTNIVDNRKIVVDGIFDRAVVINGVDEEIKIRRRS